MIIGIDASRANVDCKTGTEWYAFYLIEEIKKVADPRDQFILYSKEELKGELSKLPPNFSSRVLTWPPKILWTQLRLALEMLVRKPDALFVPAHTIPVICPKKTVTTLHDVGFEEYAHLYSTKTIGPNNKILKSLIKLLVKIISCGSYSTTELDYHRWSARLAKKKASAITTVSEFSKREIQKKLTIAGDRIHVVYPAPGKQYYRREDQTRINCIVRKYSIFSSYILYIGRIEYKKNVDTIIKGFSLYKRQQNSDSVKLVLAGKPGYGFDAIKKSILSERLDDDVILPGWVDEIDLPFLMCGAKMFIFPSRYEGFGIPIIESMSCGTPVITSNRGAMKEVAGDAAMLVDPDDPQSIANGINRVLTDDGYRTALIERGRKRSKEFSWHESAVQMIHLLKR